MLRLAGIATLLLLTLAPVAAMTKAEIIAEIADKTGLDKEEAERSVNKFFDLTASSSSECKSQQVNFCSYYLSSRARGVEVEPIRKKKPKEIVVVGYDDGRGQPVPVGVGSLDERCNFVVELQLPLGLTSDWPVTLRMKVRASVKRRADDIRACTTETLPILGEGVIDLDLYLPEPSSFFRPQVDDEVLVSLDLDIPISAILGPPEEALQDPVFDANLPNFSLYLDKVLGEDEETCSGSVTATQLGLRDQEFGVKADEVAFRRDFQVAAELDSDVASQVLEIITNNLQAAQMEPDLSIVGFGACSILKRAARTGRNPQTGAAIYIPAKNVVIFKAGNAM